MATIKSMTKAQLIAHIDAQDKQLIAAGRNIEALSLRVSIAESMPAPCSSTPSQEYWEYVRSTKAAQQSRVKSYLLYPQWLASTGR